MKFVKYIWGEDAYAVVQPIRDDDPRVVEINMCGDENGSDKSWGKLIYGSKVKYEKSGKVFFFKDIKAIEELDDDEVLNEHFTGLI